MRKARPEDMEALLAMGVVFHANSPYKDTPFNADRVEEVLLSVMESGALYVSGDPVHSMGAAIKGPTWFSYGEAAQELFLCGIHGKQIREALEGWAKKEGCSSFSMVSLENEKSPQMERLYRMAGYRPAERHFVKAL